MSFRRRFVLMAAIAAAACGETLAGPTDPIVVEPIEIQSVELNVGATRPAPVTARMRGTLGSGCDYLHSIEQRREGSGISVEIRRSRFMEGPCTLILKEFREELGLGAFAAGEYTLRVNGVSRTFSVS